MNIHKRTGFTLVELLVTMVILIITFSIAFPLRSFKTRKTLEDKELITQGVLVEKSLIAHYCRHAKELPNSLKELHIGTIDTKDFLYTKKSANEFTLSIKLAQGQWTSPRSNIPLSKEAT